MLNRQCNQDNPSLKDELPLAVLLPFKSPLGNFTHRKNVSISLDLHDIPYANTDNQKKGKIFPHLNCSKSGRFCTFRSADCE